MEKRYTIALDPTSLKKQIITHPVIKKILSHQFHGSLYLVGGAIRELALKKSPKDFDFVLSAFDDLAVLEHIFHAPSFLIGKKPLQTYRIIDQETSLDITVLHHTILEDLKRRDFTMNAIAYDCINHEFIDPLNGMADIQKAIIRLPRKETVKEDPLRILKAIRHYATLRGFTLHESLLQTIQSLKHLIHQVASERIKYELDLILLSHKSYEGLAMMEHVGLLEEIFPEFIPLKQLDRDKGLIPKTFSHTIEGFHYFDIQKRLTLDEKSLRNVAYALLFHDLGKADTYSYDDSKHVIHFFYHEGASSTKATKIMERLRFSSHEMKSILTLITQHMRIFLISNDASSEKATRRLVYKMGELTPSLILLTLCDMYGSSGGKSNAMTKRVVKRCQDVLEAYHTWKIKPLPPLINGHTLLSLGFQEGPALGRVLEEIREKQLAGEIQTQEEALAYAKESLQKCAPHEL